MAVRPLVADVHANLSQPERHTVSSASSRKLKLQGAKVVATVKPPAYEAIGVTVTLPASKAIGVVVYAFLERSFTNPLRILS